MGGELDFTVFYAQRGGKLEIAALPPLSSAVKSIFQLSSAPRGGKPEIAGMLPVHMAEIFQSDFFNHFFPSFACWWVMRRGLVPQNEGWTCVNNNWVK